MNDSRNDLIDKSNSCFTGCLPIVFSLIVINRMIWFSILSFSKGPQAALDKWHLDTFLSFLVILLFASVIAVISIVASRLRFIAGISLYGAGIALLVVLWINSFATLQLLWGKIWLIIGLILGIIGVIPLAIIALIFKGAWLAVALLVTGIVMSLVLRILGGFVMSKAR